MALQRRFQEPGFLIKVFLHMDIQGPATTGLPALL